MAKVGQCILLQNVWNIAVDKNVHCIIIITISKITWFQAEVSTLHTTKQNTQTPLIWTYLPHPSQSLSKLSSLMVISSSCVLANQNLPSISKSHSLLPYKPHIYPALLPLILLLLEAIVSLFFHWLFHIAIISRKIDKLGSLQRFH